MSADAWVVLGFGGFFVALGLLLFILLRRSDPSRAIASVTVAPGAPIALRFRTKAGGLHRVWARFEIAYHGGDDDYGIAVETEVRTAERILTTVEKRAGDRAPAIGPHLGSGGGLYRVHEWSTPAGQGVRASMPLATIPALSTETDVMVSGRVALAEGCRLVTLFVFVVPG
jgi:hypothetical protein